MFPPVVVLSEPAVRQTIANRPLQPATTTLFPGNRRQPINRPRLTGLGIRFRFGDAFFELRVSQYGWGRRPNILEASERREMPATCVNGS
jgi:hypothetical protein